ncbi:MAG: hypothetical protein M5R37_09130 [Melioribacteraceae bacterium]|jgi:hypothetical protein|nr:hypothetical protein [Melioribacteraceae bacterium]
MSSQNIYKTEKRKELKLASIFFVATVVLFYMMVQISMTLNQ